MSSNVSNGSSAPQNLPCESFYDSYYLVKVSKIVVFCIVLFCSLVGNALIVILVYKRKELRKTVNYFIANMAVSDFVFPLTTIPVCLADTLFSPSWQSPISGAAGLILCKLQSLLMSVSITVSIESLVWIALDRFVAVVLPLKVRLISSRFRASAIVSTWIVAIMINFADFYTMNLVEQNGKFYCKVQGRSNPIFVIYEYTRVALLYIAPLIVMTILYCAIAVTLRRRSKALGSAAVHQNDRRKKQAMKMSICVMVAFYLLFIPFAVVVLLWNTLEAKSCLLAEALWLISSMALCLSSTVNPIICFTFVENYRCGLREMFNSCRSKRNKENGHQEGVTLQRIRVIPETERISPLSITKKVGVNAGFVNETAK